jgi:hypothetical protein
MKLITLPSFGLCAYTGDTFCVPTAGFRPCRQTSLRAQARWILQRADGAAMGRTWTRSRDFRYLIRWQQRLYEEHFAVCDLRPRSICQQDRQDQRHCDLAAGARLHPRDFRAASST